MWGVQGRLTSANVGDSGFVVVGPTAYRAALQVGGSTMHPTQHMRIWLLIDTVFVRATASLLCNTAGWHLAYCIWKSADLSDKLVVEALHELRQ